VREGYRPDPVSRNDRRIILRKFIRVLTNFVIVSGKGLCEKTHSIQVVILKPSGDPSVARYLHRNRYRMTRG
jgi:hypothetical protein